MSGRRAGDPLGLVLLLQPVPGIAVVAMAAATMNMMTKRLMSIIRAFAISQLCPVSIYIGR